jgi:hypothetical protein
MARMAFLHVRSHAFFKFLELPWDWRVIAENRFVDIRRCELANPPYGDGVPMILPFED